MNLNFYNFSINPAGLAGAQRTHYVNQVQADLNRIYCTTSGQILLNCIRDPNFPVEIRTHPIHECNASGGGEMRGGVFAGQANYNPFDFSAAGACSTLPAGENRGRLGNEILFHELVHVFRNATHKWNQAPSLSFGMRHYTDNEEFIAVLCTNIYVSDRSNKAKSGLRASHEGYGKMDAADAARFGLFFSSKAAFGLVKQFCADNPIFTKALSDKLSDIPYNPIADFYRFPKLCEAFSAVGLMNDRNKLMAIYTGILHMPPAVALQIVNLIN